MRQPSAKIRRKGGSSYRTHAQLFSLILVILVAVATLAAEGDCETRNAPDTLERPRPTATPTVSVADIRDIVIASIEDYPRVRDAAISQDGNQISLVIIVDYATDLRTTPKNSGTTSSD